MRVYVALSLISVSYAQFPGTFLGSMSVGNHPLDVCISPDGQRAYAAVEWGYATAVDIEGYSSFSLAGLVGIDGEPVTLQCDGTGNVLYVADAENSLVHIVDTASLTITGSFPIQPFPEDMVLCQAENRIFLSHSTGLITVISTVTGAVEEVFWAGEDIGSICLSPDGSFLYIPDNGSPQETVVSTSSGMVYRVTSGIDSNCGAVSGNGERLFLSCGEWDLIGVMETEGLNMETTIDCQGTAPAEMAALPELPYLYGVHPDDNYLSVYGTDDLAYKGGFEVAGGPVNIAVHPDGERIFLACFDDNTMKVFGFDPAGIGIEGFPGVLTAVSSPSAQPAVSISNAPAGPAELRGYDVSGRIVWSARTLLSQGETREFTITDVPAGVLLVRAQTAGGNMSAMVVVLKP